MNNVLEEKRQAANANFPNREKESKLCKVKCFLLEIKITRLFCQWDFIYFDLTFHLPVRYFGKVDI